ncbi:unnamed protein product [Menidia menidia]|uniref:(Atlantic silverside) hypothetical protein n=1 Tax=Menidia menidia TaxID=238744 RepID=A0A8S4AZD6_9TELE|nr:unnamed protein product [Menidia menidia]
MLRAAPRLIPPQRSERLQPRHRLPGGTVTGGGGPRPAAPRAQPRGHGAELQHIHGGRMASGFAPPGRYLGARRGSIGLLPPNLSELRAVLLGDSWTENCSVANLLLGEAAFNSEEEPKSCVRVHGLIKGTKALLVNTPNIFCAAISEHKLTELVEGCVRLSAPGPHLFLLVVQPESFTEERKHRLCRALQLFSDASFHHSLVLTSAPKKGSSLYHYSIPSSWSSLQEVIRRCNRTSLKLRGLQLPALVENMKLILKQNDGRHVVSGHLRMEARREAPVALGAGPAAGESYRAN